jgi:hypothetical protein
MVWLLDRKPDCIAKELALTRGSTIEEGFTRKSASIQDITRASRF